MNIAFPALFVFLLALPGIILRYSYREWGWKFPVYRLPIGEELSKSTFSAAALHLLWCFLADRFGYRIVFSDVLILLTGGFGLPPTMLSTRLSSISKHPGDIAFYFLSLYVVAALAGQIGRRIVRKFRLDLRYRIFRFDNFWHYVLNAELPLFSENRKVYAEIADVPPKNLEDQAVLVFVSCVVNHGAHSFIYRGIPFDYDFDRSGKLDRIILRDVSYRELCGSDARAVAGGKRRFVWKETPRNVLPVVSDPLSIEGDVFVLNSSDAHNIGVEYFFLPEK